MNQALKRLGAIQGAAARRLAKGKERGILATTAILAFETPKPAEQSAAK